MHLIVILFWSQTWNTYSLRNFLYNWLQQGLSGRITLPFHYGVTKRVDIYAIKGIFVFNSLKSKIVPVYYGRISMMDMLIWAKMCISMMCIFFHWYEYPLTHKMVHKHVLQYPSGSKTYYIFKQLVILYVCTKSLMLLCRVFVYPWKFLFIHEYSDWELSNPLLW